MQRLVLAVLFVGAAIAVAAVAVRGARRAWGAVDEAASGHERGGHIMQRLAFFVLIALILYVSILGAA
jgi:hypothetical protein